MDVQNIADGVWYVDRQSGERKWMTGDMLMAHVRQAIAAEAKNRRRDIESVVDAIAKSVGQRRAKDHAEIETLRTEVTELKRELEAVRGMRVVGGKTAA